MRRFTAALLLAAGFLLLSGCTLSIYNNYRDIESLRIVRVLGIDLTENGVLLSDGQKTALLQASGVAEETEIPAFACAAYHYERLWLVPSADAGRLCFSAPGDIRDFAAAIGGGGYIDLPDEKGEGVSDLQRILPFHKRGVAQERDSFITPLGLDGQTEVLIGFRSAGLVGEAEFHFDVFLIKESHPPGVGGEFPRPEKYRGDIA